MPSHHDALNVSTIGDRARSSSPSNKEVLDNNASATDTNDKAYDFTQKFSKWIKADSQFFQNNPAPSLPQFKASEVTLEKNLGQGEFGVVFSISAIHPIVTRTDEGTTENQTTTSEKPAPREPTHEDTKTSDDSFSHDDHGLEGAQAGVLSVKLHLDSAGDLSQIQMENKKMSPIPQAFHPNTALLLESDVSKEYMSEHVLRDGLPRYAVKRLRKDLKGNLLIQGTADLALEANFLKSLRHPNICKMRGTIGEPGKKGFAIVMDRLTMTLREKMKEWKEACDDSGSLVSKMKHVLKRNKPSKEEQLSVQKQIYEEKLLAVYDVARALRHLAENRIIFRDLKPENVGVDIRGDLRLFDFGLAKELKAKDMTAPGMYKLTGMTGSRRYMAPEVVLRKDYGLSADVYSFAILAWEVMSNRIAYSFCPSREKHFEMVVQRKKRPNIKKMIANKKVLPEVSQIHALVNLCWSHKPLDRPSIEKVCEVLYAELLNCDDADEGSNLAVDRSKHLAMNSLRSRAGTPLWC